MALLLALLIAGCDESAPFDPGTLPTGGSETATGGGGGDSDSTTTGLGNADLVGRWRNVIILQTDTDVQTITTTWNFAASGLCARTVNTVGLAGVPSITVRAGTCRASGTQLAVLYVDATEAVVFPIQFVNFDPNRLLIGELEFGRVADGS